MLSNSASKLPILLLMKRVCILFSVTLFHLVSSNIGQTEPQAGSSPQCADLISHSCLALHGAARSQPACRRGPEGNQCPAEPAWRPAALSACTSPTLQEQRGNDALQSLSDDLISQEKASLPDSGSPTKTPGVVQQAQEKTAGALDYVEKQAQPQAGDKVGTEVSS